MIKLIAMLLTKPEHFMRYSDHMCVYKSSLCTTVLLISACASMTAALEICEDFT